MYLKSTFPLISLVVGILLSPSLSAQKAKAAYSHYFILKGTVTDSETGKLFANECLVVMGFNESRGITTNEKGEYQVEFYDSTGHIMDGAIGIPEGQIIIGDCKDPNRTKTIYLKKTRIKKTKKPEDFSKPPVVLIMNIKIGYEFEKGPFKL